MRFILVALIMLYWTNTSRAQIFEIGPYLGGANFIGDVGATNYIRPSNIAFGGIVKWNRSLRHSWRASVIYTSLKADDAKSDQGRRQVRKYSFSNSLLEATLGIEYNFWDWDIYANTGQFVPYFSTGISGIFTRDLMVDKNDNIVPDKSRMGFALPMIIGVKGKISTHLTLGFEIGARMTFYDSLDGSTKKHTLKPDGKFYYTSFGNKNNSDWYVFTGFTLTYSFGHKVCYDIF